MADLTRFARPYARAAFQYACEHQSQPLWSDALATLGSLCTDNRILALLKNPRVTADYKVATLLKLAAITDTHIANLVQLLARNKRLLLLLTVSQLFNRLKLEQEACVEVSVTSAFPLNETDSSQLEQHLAAKLSRKINLSITTDASLLGGVIIQYDNIVIDASARERLNRLSEITYS